MVRENLKSAEEYSKGWSISQKLLFYSLGSLGGWPGMAAVAGFHWFDNENNDRQSREYTSKNNLLPNPHNKTPFFFFKLKAK